MSEILTSFQAGDKPRFEFHGKNRILEYLDVWNATGTIPELIWVFWFGPTMSPNRAKAFATMDQMLEIPVILVGDQRLRNGQCIREYLIFPEFTKQTIFEYTLCITTAGHIQKSSTSGNPGENILKSSTIPMVGWLGFPRSSEASQAMQEQPTILTITNM